MSRINTNVSSLIAQRILGDQNQKLTGSLERLSTGLRINRGGDDPAGLIASESLRSQQASISAAIGNAERAEQVVNVAEGGLQEVNSLLLEVQSLVGQSANEAGISKDEKEANQLQIDSILQTIDRIASTTSFQGTKLLNGTFDFQLESQNANVTDVTVNAAKLEFGQDRDVDLLVTQSAQRAGLFLSLGGALDLSAADALFTVDIAGVTGSREFTFGSGTALADVVTAINTFTDITGVSAATSGTGVSLKSTEFGSSEFVSVDITNRAGQAGSVLAFNSNDENTAITVGATAFTAATNPIRDTGQDVGAIINGVAATSSGKTARIATDFLDVQLELNDTGATTLGAVNAVTIKSGGGAQFNLGPNVDLGNQVSIGIENVAARNLGTQTNGFLSSLASGKANNVVDGDLSTGQKIINDAIAQVTGLRGRLGAFQKNTVGATIRSLGVALENTSAAESAIRDTDFAEETAELTRAQILQQASTNVLGIANSQPQAVLSLL